MIRVITSLSILMVLCTSCGSNESSDKQFKKAQKIYDKKGMVGFYQYVNKNAYIAVKDASQNGATPFLLSVKTGDIEKAALFLEKGASLDEQDSDGRDVIDYALENSDSATLDFVISKMPASYWNTLDADDNFAFIRIIVHCSDFNLVKKAIDCTNDINHANKNAKTPLMYAAQCNADVRTVKYLLDKGVKIDAKNYNEWTALMYAARYNPNPAVMEDLILRGAHADPNSVGLTISMLAACNPNPGVLLTLLKYKNEVNMVTGKGKSALMYACENKQNSSVIKMLIDNNADLHIKDEHGKTALMYALEQYTKPESVYVLLAAGAKTNDKDNNGKTIRDYLSANEHLSATDILNAFGVTKSVAEEQYNQDSDSHTDAEHNAELNSEEGTSESTEINESNMAVEEKLSENTEGKKE